MMPSSLTKDQRSLLARVTLEAREAAETAARAALENLAVHEHEYRGHMTVDQRLLRNRLRARGRALGDRLDPRTGTQAIDHLAESAAYEHWHRLLFTRFLAENQLLHTDEQHDNVPVTLEECDELAPELGARDGFELACRFASQILPGVFRRDDPVLELRLAPNHAVQLRRLVDRLPPEVFRADDALGWTYQFWQAKRKDQINKSGVKIGADELPAVTQLFTEDYMVEFLLHNSIGAWWAGKESARLAPSIETEDEARRAVSLPPRDGLPGIDWTYLRFVRESEHHAGAGASRPRDLGAGRPDSFEMRRDGPVPFVNPFAEIEVTANLLPHWQQGDAWIFVTWRLADSLPADKLRQWEDEKDAWLAVHPQPWDEPTTRAYHERFTQRIEDWLDAGHGACILRQPEVREIVVDALAYFAGQRYELGHWVVMPNHVHVLFRPLAGHRLPEILHAWKGFTAKEINRLLGRTGSVWQEDYWDRLVRNERHLDACQRYIVQNPVKANLPPGDWSGFERSGGVPPPIPGQDAPAPFKPAAGTFGGWPRRAAEIRFLDPCMGSGHFLVFALPILARLRMEEEGLGAPEAVAAVLRDNLHGLEIDERCTQIAAFNVALSAWRLGGYQPLPPLHFACSGLAPQATKADWMALADRAAEYAPVPPRRDLLGIEDNLFTTPLRAGMERLYDLFRQAPVLGSLIDPHAITGDLITADFHYLQPILEHALNREPSDARRELAITAQGLTKAAAILAGRFTLVATNVPYLTRGKQSETLRRHCETHYPEAKNDLANCFLERCLALAEERGRLAPSGEKRGAGRPASSGSVQLVMPQNWLFLGSYRKQRERLLRELSWNLLGRLGAGAFETISGEVVNAILLTLTNTPPPEGFMLAGLDASAPRGVEEKVSALRGGEVVRVSQAGQLGNPDSKLSFAESTTCSLLLKYVSAPRGIVSGDRDYWVRFLWELPVLHNEWRPLQSAVSDTTHFGARESVINWNTHGEGMLRPGRGNTSLRKLGVIVSQVRELPCTLYTGDLYDNSAFAIVPTDPAHLPAVWAFCSSADYNDSVRQFNKRLSVDPSHLIQVPFDLAHWQQVAAEKYPNGLPKPHSDDPTQWLFNGHPKGSEQPLQVAVARLLGYRWPRQTGSEFPDCPALGTDGLEGYADNDGIVCLPPINKEQPAAARLRNLLAAAWSGGVPPPIPGQDAPTPKGPTPVDERALLASAGAKSARLEDWLRDEFFEQHCKLFHNRPFVWHVWDGRKDGFHALVNYHRLDHANLQKLTYSYLGDWIRQQEADARADKPGAAERLGAAQALEAELMKILEGEPPYDLFIRWKPLKEQPLGWQPDLNDGVRLNIRPFMQARDVGKKGAGILRAKPNIKWDKDRGTEPHRDKADYPWFWHAEEPPLACPGGPDFTGNRWNSVHLTLARKRAARQGAESSG